MWIVCVGLFAWVEKKTHGVRVAVKVSATTFAENGRADVVVITYHGFHVGKFPHPTILASKQDKKRKRREGQCLPNMYGMLFDNHAKTSLRMNQGEKKKAC